VLSQQPCHDVVAAAGRKWHHDHHRARWIILRRRKPGRTGKAGDQQRHDGSAPAHSFLLERVLAQWFVLIVGLGPCKVKEPLPARLPQVIHLTEV
jgi:hypothetical protein